MIGKNINQYRVLEKIGEGGMGEIYLALDTSLDRKIVLKFMSPKSVGSRKLRERFLREAKAAAALNHPNIVTIHEINDFEGRLYIAMEYVVGKTLEDILASPPQLPIEKLLEYTAQIASGLEAAHRAGIIHRDIKPLNLIINENNQVKILDFGLAKLIGGAKLTGAIARIGTLPYMSPEQVVADPIDHRTDIWSFGVVMYQMATCRFPFPGDDSHTIIKGITKEPPQRPSDFRDDIPQKLESIILKCLGKSPENRYASAGLVLDELSRLKSPLSTPSAISATASVIIKDTERRYASILSVEISGYDALQAQLDPEEAAVLINDCLDTLQTFAKNSNSGMTQIMGNELICFFGVPTAIEDAPKSAVNAAIETRKTFYQWKNEHCPQSLLDIRMGLNSGLVIAGPLKDKQSNGRENEYSVIGDSVTLASLLKGTAADGQIIAGASVHQYTANQFQYSPLKAITPEGRKNPVEVFLLNSTEPHTGPREFTNPRMIFSSQVGREKELDRLKLHLLKVINGEGSVVCVTGEAGIGKSRLISEWTQLEDMGKVRLLEGTAFWRGRHMAYHPIIDIIKQWAGIKEEHDDAQSLMRLEQAVNAVCSLSTGDKEVGENGGSIGNAGNAGIVNNAGIAANTGSSINIGNADDIFPFIATLMGLTVSGKHAQRLRGIEGEALARLIRKYLRDLLQAGARQLPRVYIIHDIHWADISSIELVESLFGLMKHQPILLVLVMRPGFADTGDRLLETLRQNYSAFFSHIPLLPLDSDQCDRLILNLVDAKELPEKIRTAIVQRAGGNPFFIEEVLRSFIDDGVVTFRGGKLKITPEIETVVIPKTIRDVVMSRIDRLDDTSRSLLKTASVIGRFFFYKVLAEVARGVENIDDLLSYLKEAQLIAERKRLEEVEYLFNHALVQEVAYESILLSKRKKLHLKVASAIETVFARRLHEFYGLLALHYNKGENLEKAEIYLLKAGEEALKAAASDEALTYYREALKLYLVKYSNAVDLQQIAVLERNIALALYNKGIYAEAVEHFDEALKCWGVGTSPNRFRTLWKFMTSFIGLMRFLYLPAFKRPRVPDKRDHQIIDTAQKRAAALSDVDVTRFFTDSLGVLNRLVKLDIPQVNNGPAIFAASSGLFSYTGISFKISRKILKKAVNYFDKDDIKGALVLKYVSFIHHFHSGSWPPPFGYDAPLVDRNLEVGEFFFATAFPEQCGFLYIEQGDFLRINEVLEKLYYIGDAFGSDLAIGRMHLLDGKRAIKSGCYGEALPKIEKAMDFMARAGHSLFLLIAYGMKAYIEVLTEDLAGAEATLKKAHEIIPKSRRIAPNKIGSLLMSQFLFSLGKLKEALRQEEKGAILFWRLQGFRDGKKALKNAAKYAPDRVEVFRWMGVYYWLIGQQGKSLRWWDKSIRTGLRLGARAELARTYHEVGKRLAEKNAKYRLLNGIPAPDYTTKAKDLFDEMN